MLSEEWLTSMIVSGIDACAAATLVSSSGAVHDSNQWKKTSFVSLGAGA